VSKEQIIWGGNYFNLPVKRGWICWYKGVEINIPRRRALNLSHKSVFINTHALGDEIQMNLPNFAMWQHQNLLENDENNHFSAGIKLKNPNCGPFLVSCARS
jgi:hypothetical protein